jgi:hypothetical protein
VVGQSVLSTRANSKAGHVMNRSFLLDCGFPNLCGSDSADPETRIDTLRNCCCLRFC